MVSKFIFLSVKSSYYNNDEMSELHDKRKFTGTSNKRDQIQIKITRDHFKIYQVCYDKCHAKTVKTE